MPAVSHRFLATAWAALVMAIAVHNLEEWWRDMSGWMSGQSWMALPSVLHGDRWQLGIALLLVTVTAAAIAVVAVTRRASWSAPVLSCVCYAMLINAVSHLGMSLATGSVMPGAITAAVVLLPVCGTVLYRLPAMTWTTWSVVITAAAALLVTFGSLALAAVIR